MDPEYRERLKNKLAPEAVRAGLIRAGIFLAAWELLKGEIQDKVRGFYIIGFDPDHVTIMGDYKARVLDKHPSGFEASLLWLIETGAFDAAQAERVRALRTKRNEVAHELPKLLIDPDHDVSAEALAEIRDLLGILGRFWGSIEVDTNPDFDNQDVDYAGIQSGAMLLIGFLLEVAEELKSQGP